MKYKFKLRHIIFSVYALFAAVAILTAFDVIQLTWLELASPFIAAASIFILYFLLMLVWSSIEIKKQVKRLAETEVSFFCDGCARPFAEPQRHKKGEPVFHKGCQPKQ